MFRNSAYLMAVLFDVLLSYAALDRGRCLNEWIWYLSCLKSIAGAQGNGETEGRETVSTVPPVPRGKLTQTIYRVVLCWPWCRAKWMIFFFFLGNEISCLVKSCPSTWLSYDWKTQTTPCCGYVSAVLWIKTFDVLGHATPLTCCVL